MKSMINFKFLLLLFLSLFICMSDVSADLCDTAHIKQLKALAGKVDVTYEYEDESLYEDEDFIVSNGYKVFINMVSNDFYITVDNRNYYYSDANDGVLMLDATAGRFKAEIKSKQCGGYSLRKVYIDLPKFNVYSYMEECKGLEEYNLDVCNPWYQGTVNNEIFYREVNEYLKTTEIGFFDKILNFIKNNYLIIGGCCLGIVLIIVFIFVYRKRSVLE